MSALTEIFNHLFAYLVFFVTFFFDNGEYNYEVLSPEVNSIILNMAQSIDVEQLASIRPIVWLSTGIFACGAIIGLAKRLIK